MGPLYSWSLAGGGPLHAVYPDGRRVPVPVDSWRGPLLPGDDGVLDRCRGTTLDIGCGPGRLLVGLHLRDVPCLGIDVTGEAVRQARATGAAAVRCSVFGDVPAAGRWATALLVDGNIGIGGAPRVLLGRAAELLAGDGCMLVEVEPPGSSSDLVDLRLAGGGRLSTPFPWARLAAQDVPAIAAQAGLRVVELWEEADRWFARLELG